MGKTGGAFGWPIGIGGVGGSGTRVIAAILREVGYRLGVDLNQPLDNLWFTLLFKRTGMLNGSVSQEEFSKCWRLFSDTMSGSVSSDLVDWARDYVPGLHESPRMHHPASWLAERATSLLDFINSVDPNGVAWAWKEPNTHIVLDRLLQECSELRYIHVIRHGLDMAFSKNQNQLEFWGDRFLSQAERALPVPIASLKYWCRTNKRVFEIAKHYPESFYVVDFDAVCTNSMLEVEKLLAFLGYDFSRGEIQFLSKLIRVPGSVGRYRSRPLDLFDAEDLEYVRSLGYVIENRSNVRN